MPGLFTDIREVIARIPEGFVATYGQIAAMVGRPRNARVVAWALHTTSDQVLPCHRVVAKTGELAPDHVFGGRSIQHDLLEAEGVTFLGDGTIDMAMHLWQPEA